MDAKLKRTGYMANLRREADQEKRLFELTLIFANTDKHGQFVHFGREKTADLFATRGQYAPASHARQGNHTCYGQFEKYKKTARKNVCLS